MRGAMVVTKSVLEVWKSVGFFDKFVQSPKDYTFCDFTEGAEDANRAIARGLVEWFTLFREANDCGFFPKFREVLKTHHCINYVAKGYCVSVKENFEDFVLN